MGKRHLLIVVHAAFICCTLSCASQNNKKNNSTNSNDTVVETNKNMNGQVIMTTTFVNGIEQGPYKMYYDDGTLEAEGYNANGKIFGKVKSYTPAGKLAKIEVWDTVPNPYTSDNKMMSRLVDEIVFWEEIPAEYHKYLFVSDSGYYRVKGGVYNKDLVKPDNIIETKSDDKGTDVFIWKNGQKELYKRVTK